MTETEAPWPAGLVLVCTRCGERRVEEGDAKSGREDDARELRDRLKERLKDEGLWNKDGVRVVATGCLGVCPPGRVAVVVGSQADGAQGRCFTVDPRADEERLLAWIRTHCAEVAARHRHRSPDDDPTADKASLPS